MIVNIQALRCLAALLVVIVHCEDVIKPLGDYHFVTLAASSGVDLFFVISGFIMVFTTDRSGPSPIEFFTHRLARVAPLYWLLTIAVFALALIAPHLLGATKANLVHLMNSLLFIPYLRDDGKIAPVLFLGWTLNYEMMFYLIFSLCLFIKQSHRRVLVACTILLAITFIGHLANPENIPARFFTRPIILEFGMGMLIARLHRRLPENPAAAFAAAMVTVAAVPLMLLAAALPLNAFPLTGLPASALVIAALVMDRGGLSVTWRPVLLLGNASYSLYLTHPFVAQFVTKFSARYHFETTIEVIALIAVIYLSSMILAIAVYWYIETPMGRVARQAIPNRRRMGPVVPS